MQANRETVVKKINEWDIDFFFEKKLASDTVKSRTSSMAISQTTKLIRCEHNMVPVDAQDLQRFKTAQTKTE